MRVGAFFLWVFAFVVTAHAASPQLDDIRPTGAQRGSEVEVTFTGQRLDDARGILIYDEGIAVKELGQVEEKQVKAKLAVSPDAALGEHQMRVWTASGISELRTFWVGPFPSLEEIEPNNDREHAQRIDADVTVAGVVKNEDSDWFSIDAKKGERISVEVEGMRLGRAMFDAMVAVTDTAGEVLARSDDAALFLQDPAVSVVAPADGVYFVEIRESSNGGDDKSVYRMHVGHFPRPMAVFPAAGRPGEELAVKLIDATGEQDATVRLPDHEGLFAFHADGIAPGANPLRVSALPATREVEPNDSAAEATRAGSEGAVGLDGQIGKPGDVDWFRFIGKKDNELDVRVFARSLRSPLDSVLVVGKADGSQVADNDDKDGADSVVRFKPPADGEYTLSIRDQIGRGGAEYVYRIEVASVAPELAVTIPPVDEKTQERQVIVVPRGNRFATMMRVQRGDTGGDVNLQIEGLPAGVTMHAEPLVNGDLVPVVFEAAADAEVAAALCTLTPKNAKVSGAYEQAIGFNYGQPNNSPYYMTRARRLAVSVAEAAPFSLRLEEPGAALPQSGALSLKVVAERTDGFEGEIKLRLLSKPPGVGAADTITLGKDATEAEIPLSANGDAKLLRSQIAVLGDAESVWVSTELVEIEIAPPFMTGELQFTKVARGETAAVVCKLKPVRAFEGKAKLRLMGLPDGLTSPELEIAADATEVTFQVATDDKIKGGQKRGLFCQLELKINGQEIAQTLAANGVLRIDVKKEEK